MKTNALLLSGAVLVAAFTFGACNCGNPNPPGNNDGGADGNDSGYDGDLVITDGGPGSQCLPDGHPCTASSGGVCCSGTCDPGGFCKASGTFCMGPGEACTSNTQCCTNNCANGACSNIQCQGQGAACNGNGDCCSGTCSNGTCQALAGSSCGIIGEACTAGSGCCSTNCQGGVCVRAYSCQANGDICYGNDECCGRACSKNDGTPGVCLAVSGGGGGGCLQSGNPCEGSGTNCCTRICADPGSGASVCQPQTGCVMTGQFCSSDQACCGGGTNPNTTVKCDTATSRCDNGSACQPVGNICGAAVLMDGGSVNAPQNCCDGPAGSPNQPPYRNCRMDSTGIPRCFGGCPNDVCPQDCPTGYTGQAPCCIQAGDQCQFKDQCCNGAPCVPDSQGILRCTTATCTPLGGACTPGSTNECCLGTDCIQSEIGAACQLPQPKPDGGTLPDGGSVTPDGGAPDAGPLCKPNGQTCSVSSDCCSTICNNGTCQTPTACQPQGSVCTASADCCTGLGCTVPAGQSTGTCQPSSCQSAGQACSPTNPCCTGLNCLTPTGTACSGTTNCTCTVIIN